MAKDLFNRYIWLVDTIYRAGRITFEELNERWVNNDMSEGEDIPLRTFHNHRKAIEEMFDINIECDKRGGYTYFIENADDMERGGVRQWLINTFAVNNLINESHKLKNRILIEHIPSGQKFLTPIIEAMRDNLPVELTYQSYWSDKPHTVEVEPYCVKVFRQRWYLHANSPKGRHTYALDRISHVRATDKKFKIDKSFDAEAYFSDCFGIIHDEDINVETVELRVRRDTAKDCYFKALPLHHTQATVSEDDDCTVFSYYLRPTYDFRMELLSHGADVEVLKPRWFREQMAEQIKKMGMRYDE